MSMKFILRWQKSYSFFIILILLVACLILLGCGPPPTTTSSYTPSPTTPTATGRQWTWVPSPGNTVTSGSYAYFPLNGAYVHAGRTLSLSWSADGNLESFVFTENQYSNFKRLLYASAWIAHGSGTNGTVSAYIQNGDTYYAVVRNTFTLGPSVKLYQAVLTEQ